MVTLRPAFSSTSATEIASNVPVSSKITAGPCRLGLGPTPNRRQLSMTSGRSWPGIGRAGVEIWKPSVLGVVPVAMITSSALISRIFSSSTRRVQAHDHAQALDLLG